ncbi:cysteine-rich receptor-like protein kinase, partial [Trifolium pratense]
VSPKRKVDQRLKLYIHAMIPKVNSPQRLNEFRPVSLVGSLYKILAKILDGILIANEVVDEARRMSFPTLWRKWIKACVCTATASVLVNGSPTNEFPLERGLREGGSLSPFLFLLVAESLNVLMKAMVERNLFTGYSVGAQNQVYVSHIQFADDTSLIRVKSWANVRALQAVLVLCESMSGLKVNFHKSMLVGVNIPDSWLHEVASAL